MSSKRQEVTLMNNFTETAADIRLSTAVPNYRGADCCRVLPSHLGVKRNTAGKSARPTLRAGISLCISFWFVGLVNLKHARWITEALYNIKLFSHLLAY